jgi:DNA polymerase elongation subunit (family B)
MTVFNTLKQVVGVDYASAQHNKDILDAYFLRLGRDADVRLPTGSEPDRYNYHGAHVFTPTAGLNHHVVYVDLRSLYPNIMRALNVGPDTIIGTQADLDESEYTEDDCVWGYIDPRPVKHVRKGEDWRVHAHDQFKMVYERDTPTVKWVDDPRYERCYYLHPDVREGFIAEGIQRLLDMKYQYEGDLYEAVKRVVNSAYGFMGFATENNSSRLYDWRIAESITLAGRKVIKETADFVRRYLWQECGVPAEDTYVALGDTDGAGICWPDAPDRDTLLEMVQSACRELNERAYPSYMAEEFGVPEDRHYMEVEVESYASSAFVPATDYDDPRGEGRKKRYAQHVSWDEGEEVDEVDVTGFEAVRSDTSPLTTQLQTWVLDQLTRHGRDARTDIFGVCKAVEQAVRDGKVPVEQIAKRGGIGQPLAEYGTSSRRPSPLYRGAKYADEYLGVDLSEGSKPFVVYLESPDGLPRSTYLSETAENGDVVDAISVEHARDLPESLDVAWTKHADKAITEPLRPILRTIGWSWAGIRDETVQAGLANF